MVPPTLQNQPRRDFIPAGWFSVVGGCNALVAHHCVVMVAFATTKTVERVRMLSSADLPVRGLCVVSDRQ